MLAFLAARALAGIEHVTADAYARTVQLGKAKGWIAVTQSRKKHALVVEFPHTLTPVLPALLRRVRALFDLNARPDLIAQHLGRDPALAAAVKANPGLRVPGAFNGFEMGMRAILGPAGHGEGGDHHRVPVRRGVRRADRHAVRRAESPHAGAGARRGGQRGRRSPGTASSRARSRSIIALAKAHGVGRALRSTAARTRSRRFDPAAGRAARHRPVDRALHRHARAALARRVSRRKTSPCASGSAASPRRKPRRCRRRGGRGAATR